MNTLVLFAVATGACFSLLATTSKMAIRKGAHPLHPAIVMGLSGGVWFLPAMLGELSGVSPGVAAWPIAIGLFNGCVRYFAIRLWNRALQMGPLSPMVCVYNLGFIMTLPYVWAFHAQPPTTMHWLAAGAATAAVLFAAKSNSANQVEDDVGGISAAYLAVLALVWVTGGLGNVLVKMMDLAHLPDGTSELARFGSVFWGCEHFALGVIALVDCLLTKKTPPSYGQVLFLGLLAQGGALLGIVFLRQAISLPPAVYFSASNVTIICVTALIGTVAFREKRSLWWYLAIATAVGAVLTANAGA